MLFIRKIKSLAVRLFFKEGCDFRQGFSLTFRVAHQFNGFNHSFLPVRPSFCTDNGYFFKV